MESFLFRIVIFLTLLTVVGVGLHIIPELNINKGNYISSLIDKHNRLKEIKSPKIIIAGDSGFAFGVDSKQIEHAFNLPVVNLALHAGLGTSFILEELKYSIQENDIVLISFAYFLKDGQERLKKRAIDAYPEAINFCKFGFTERINYLKENTQENLKQKIRNLVQSKNAQIINEEIYLREGFNKYGDFIAHLRVKKKGKSLKGKNTMKYRYWDNGITGLNSLEKYARKINVSVFYFYPSYAKSQFFKNKKIISRLKNDLEKELSIEIVNNPRNFIYDDNLFFDTVYHLNKKGRKINTKKIIKLLRKNKKMQSLLKKTH